MLNSNVLVWGTSSENDSLLNRQIPMESIERVLYGPSSLTMIKFNDSITSRLCCISFIVKTKGTAKVPARRRTIDLELSSEDETLAFYVALTRFVLLQKVKGCEPALENKSDQEIVNSAAFLAEFKVSMSKFNWTKFRLQIDEAAAQENTSTGSIIAREVLKLRLSEPATSE